MHQHQFVFLYFADVSVTLLALQHLAETSAHEVVRSKARGALWILEGKEQKMPSLTTEVSSTPAGSFHSIYTIGADLMGPRDSGCRIFA